MEGENFYRQKAVGEEDKGERGQARAGNLFPEFSPSPRLPLTAAPPHRGSPSPRLPLAASSYC
jgi:hypothetical protein